MPVGSVRSRLDWAITTLAPPRSDAASIRMHKIFVIAEPPQAVCFPARGNATCAWAFPRSISSTVGKGVSHKFTGSRVTACGLNSWRSRGASSGHWWHPAATPCAVDTGRLQVSGHPAKLSAALLPTPMTPRYGPAMPAPSSAVLENPARLDDDAVAQPAAIPCRTYR